MVPVWIDWTSEETKRLRITLIPKLKNLVRFLGVLHLRETFCSLFASKNVQTNWVVRCTIRKNLRNCMADSVRRTAGCARKRYKTDFSCLWISWKRLKTTNNTIGDEWSNNWWLWWEEKTTKMHHAKGRKPVSQRRIPGKNKQSPEEITVTLFVSTWTKNILATVISTLLKSTIVQKSNATLSKFNFFGRLLLGFLERRVDTFQEKIFPFTRTKIVKIMVILWRESDFPSLNEIRFSLFWSDRKYCAFGSSHNPTTRNDKASVFFALRIYFDHLGIKWHGSARHTTQPSQYRFMKLSWFFYWCCTEPPTISPTFSQLTVSLGRECSAIFIFRECFQSQFILLNTLAP